MYLRYIAKRKSFVMILNSSNKVRNNCNKKSENETCLIQSNNESSSSNTICSCLRTWIMFQKQHTKELLLVEKFATSNNNHMICAFLTCLPHGSTMKINCKKPHWYCTQCREYRLAWTIFMLPDKLIYPTS